MLRPAEGEARVMVQRAGFVTGIAVREGERVEAGDVLATVVSDAKMRGGGLLAEGRREARAAEASVIESRIAANAEAVRAQVDELGLRAEALRQRAASFEAQAELARERIALAEERVAAGRTLAERGLMPAEEMRRREEALIAARAALLTAETEAAGARGELARIPASMARLEAEGAAFAAWMWRDIAGLEARSVSEEAEAGVELRAPRAGVVTQLSVVEGTSVEPGRQAMVIVPEDGVLHAEVWVPSRAIGFVRPGQSVRVLYDAFPHQVFGASAGRVESVSATAVLPADLRAPVELREPVYRVRVALAAQHVTGFGEARPLAPGMMLKADIVLEERSLGEWLRGPILAVRGRL